MKERGERENEKSYKNHKLRRLRCYTHNFENISMVSSQIFIEPLLVSAIAYRYKLGSRQMFSFIRINSDTTIFGECENPAESIAIYARAAYA